MNVDKRVDGWYASLTIPSDVRKEIGKSKFLRKLSTTTDSKGRAAQEAAPIIKQWKRDIKKIRDFREKEDSKSDQLKLLEEALQWKAELTAASDDLRADLSGVLMDRLEALELKMGTKVSHQFNEVTLGTKTPLEPFYEEWSKSKLKNYSPKTADSYKRDAKIFVDKFTYLEAVTKRDMKIWIAELMDHGADASEPKPMTYTTLRDRFMCGVRHFYNYLDGKGLIDENMVNPMMGVIPKKEKTKITNANVGWTPFDPKEVVQLYHNIPVDDLQLPSITAIAMFTGMRIEEVCSLTTSQIIDVEGIRCFDIRDSKTKAGIRIVPIHTLLESLVDRLLFAAKGDTKEALPDAYLIAGLGVNKYGDRSNAVGKRFGSLKKQLGFNEKKVFHSIRKCVVTQLDNAEFRETAIADLVGHENPRMTMGRYSAGIDVFIRKPMIESIQYPSLVLK